MGSNKQCQSCNREFSVFIRPYSCELCNQRKLCSNCARKFVLSYEPNPAYLRLCNGCCDKVSKGNQLKHPSKSSKNKDKNNSVWSLASSWIGKSSSKKQYSSKQSQSINLSSHSPPTSCTICCSTQNKLINKQFAEYTNKLKDQAPLFPENYNLSTPQRKQNIICRQRLSDEETDNVEPIKIENDNDNDDDDDHYLYRTIHPLNNLKLKPPKSILSVSQNEVALNISINRDETQHCIGNLEKTSLCDCFSSMLKKKQNIQITNDDESQNNGAMPRNPNYNEHIDSFHRCVTLPIKHKTFKLLRIDLLFDDREYNELIGDQQEKYASINVSLYDHQSQMYSGVQIVKINDIKPYRIISQISVQCNQTLLKKSVTVVGSMAWTMCSNSENEDNLTHYPYKTCNISEMISFLTQQRFDIIESYDTVIQQRTTAKNKFEKENGIESSQSSLRKNQVHPKLERDEDSSSKEDYEVKLYPVKDIPHEDGGSKIPTKRTEVLPDIKSLSLDDNHNPHQQSTVLLSGACSPKHSGVKVQEMEKNMLQHEIARIDSMILGLETVISCINENHSQSTPNNHQFDELPSSITSSYMFNTNELNEVKTKIADHLTQDPNINNMSQQLIPEKTKEKVVHRNVSNLRVDIPELPKLIPICLCCQRCSRTIILRETT